MFRFGFSFSSKFLLKMVTKKQKKMMAKVVAKSHARQIGKIRLDITILKKDIQNAKVSHIILKNGNRKKVFDEDMAIDVEPIPVAEESDVYRKSEFIRLSEKKLKKKEKGLRKKEKAYAKVWDKLYGYKPFERKK